MRRAQALGIGLALQNRLTYRAASTARAWGNEAVAQAPPLRRMLELGFPLSGGTDATVVSSITRGDRCGGSSAARPLVVLAGRSSTVFAVSRR